MKTTETNPFEAIIALIVAIILSAFLMFYEIFLIQKLISWFNVPFTFTNIQLFGILSVVSIISFSNKTSKTEDKGIWYTALGKPIEKAAVISFLLLVYFVIKLAIV